MFVKSSRPTYKRRVKKAQEGIKFATYTPVEVNQTDYRDLTSIDNPFNEFNFATTYDKPTALVVPETAETKNEVETKSEPVVVNNPTPPVVIDKPTQNVSTSTTWRSPYKDRAKWTKDLSDAYRKVGITNDNAIRMLLAQDALESGWGKSAQGKYNFGNLTTGSSWKGNYVVGNDKNAKGEAIKQKFRAYESMDDYAKDKIQFLKRLYDFDENDDINKFVAKLTGSNKGKRRYAEASNYAKLLTGVYNGIPKGQNGLVIQRDAVKDYRPEIPLSPIKQRYMPTQQPILSQDNRSKWERNQSDTYKAEIAKNENLYKNQHTWNWSAPFTNARTTKDNASAMFDFDKSAAMSTFATGMGIANPVATGVSMASSLVGAGIGNKVAGEKGALVGGFVGGMVNPKIRFGKSSSTNPTVKADLIYGSKINGKMAKLSQAEAEKANQVGFNNATKVLSNPTVVETANRNTALAERIGMGKLHYETAPGKYDEFENTSAVSLYRMTEAFPTTKIIRTDLGESGVTGRFRKTKGGDVIELDNSVDNLQEALQIMTHENLHKGRYGEFPIQMKKAEKLIDVNRANSTYSKAANYLLTPGEAATNANDLRVALGLDFGHKYPGWKVTKEIVDMFSRSRHPKAFVMKSFKQDTPRDYKRIWDALTGKWFMYPAIGVGINLMNY